MGHSDNKTLCAHFCTRVNCYFKSGHESFAAFETKAFHGVELLSGKVAELVSPVEAGVKMQFFFFRNFLVLDALKTCPDPVLLFLICNMHEFDANLAAVGISVGLNEVLEFPDALFFANASSVLGMHVVFFVKVCLSKPVGFVVTNSLFATNHHFVRNQH